MTKRQLKAENEQLFGALETARRQLQRVLAVVEGALASERADDSEEEE